MMSGGTVKMEDGGGGGIPPGGSLTTSMSPSSSSKMISPSMGMFKTEPGPEDSGNLGTCVGAGTAPPDGALDQGPPVDSDKHKAANTAQRIRGALEASGLAGNLTAE